MLLLTRSLKLPVPLHWVISHAHRGWGAAGTSVVFVIRGGTVVMLGEGGIVLGLRGLFGLGGGVMQGSTWRGALLLMVRVVRTLWREEQELLLLLLLYRSWILLSGKDRVDQLRMIVQSRKTLLWAVQNPRDVLINLVSEKDISLQVIEVAAWVFISLRYPLFLHIHRLNSFDIVILTASGRSLCAFHWNWIILKRTLSLHHNGLGWRCVIVQIYLLTV